MGGGPNDTVLITLPLPEKESITSHLKTRFPGLEIHYVQTNFSRDSVNLASQVPKHLWRSATILVTLFTFPPSLEDAPNLEYVHLISAGSNQMQKEPLYKDSDVTITTSTGIHGPQIAEWVIMTALVQSHGYKHLYEHQKQRKWKGWEGHGPVVDKAGKRLGVLGYGSIGRQVGRVAQAMGMDVVAYTASKKDTPEKKRDNGFIVPGTGDEKGEIPVEWYDGLEKDKLQHFLKQDLDWLVVSVPLTNDTFHFLGKDEFDALSQGGKRPAFVTNIARGQIIDQHALIDALKDGRVSGAALDVTDPEPLPEDNELWEMENVIITPHVSGNGSVYLDRTFQVFEINLERREKGERLLNVVDRKKGY